MESVASTSPGNDAIQRIVGVSAWAEQVRRSIELVAVHQSSVLILGAVVAACKIATGRSGRFVGEQGMHLHGGIGMTDDLVLSHYYKRLMVTEARFGSAAHHLDRAADALAAGNATTRVEAAE